MKSLKSGAYAFNTPSPIGAENSTIVIFQIDPSSTPDALGESLEKAAPGDQIKKGSVSWSTRMRVTLGGKDFAIAEDPVGQAEQFVASSGPTTWKWQVTPLHPGKDLPLTLNVQNVMPVGTGVELKNILVPDFDRKIKVTVTWLWLIHLVDWKWLLGGIGTAAFTVFGWWWKNRSKGKGNSGKGGNGVNGHKAPAASKN